MNTEMTDGQMILPTASILTFSDLSLIFALIFVQSITKNGLNRIWQYFKKVIRKILKFFQFLFRNLQKINKILKKMLFNAVLL